MFGVLFLSARWATAVSWFWVNTRSGVPLSAYVSPKGAFCPHVCRNGLEFAGATVLPSGPLTRNEEVRWRHGSLGTRTRVAVFRNAGQG